jgi:hypothetical protein
LLASAHAEAEEHEPEQEDGKRRSGHGPADGQCAEQAQQESQHQPYASAVAIREGTNRIRDEEATPAQDARGDASQRR